MAFFKINTSEENIKDSSGNGGRYLNKSGMYDVIINAAIVSISSNGAESVNLWVKYQDQDQMIYRAIGHTNNDGSPSFEQNLFTKLAVITGGTDGEEIADPVSKMLPVGKGGEEVECMVLEEFTDTPVSLRLQMEYSLWEGEIRENKKIRNFFRYEDKATASEIVNNSEEKGKQYAIESESADKVVYKNDLTEEDIAEWRKNLRTGKKEEPKAKASFGQKRTFGRKV